MSDVPSGSVSEHRDWRATRWTSRFWIVEVLAIAAVPLIILLLQYSEEGVMRREGVRVSASVDELPLGVDSCRSCPLVFELYEERHVITESLVALPEREYVPGETIELYVDPSDVAHAIEARAIQENIVLGLVGVVVAISFAVAWLAYEFKRALRG